MLYSTGCLKPRRSNTAPIRDKAIALMETREESLGQERKKVMISAKEKKGGRTLSKANSRRVSWSNKNIIGF